MSRRNVVPHRRVAFTLVEVLIVVVMISIIAGVAISLMGSSTEDANLSGLYTNEQLLQGAIDRYKIDHGGQGPDVVEVENLPQLTERTNSQGQRGTGSAYPFGPYLVNEVPINPVTTSRRINTTTESPPSDLSDPNAGWIYNPTTGQIWGVQGLASGSKSKLNAKIK